MPFDILLSPLYSLIRQKLPDTTYTRKRDVLPMIRPLVHNDQFLSIPSTPAGKEDLAIVRDLTDTLKAHRSSCVGMAANMIGFSKCIIVIAPFGMPIPLLNPRILSQSGPYETEEGCLCHTGQKSVTRYQRIEVVWEDPDFQEHTAVFEAFTAQIIQHEVDHLHGILI